MENTISVYDGLALVKSCFAAIGDTATVLRDQFVPACRDWVETLKVVDATHKRICAMVSR